MKEKLLGKDDVRSLHPLLQGRLGDFLIPLIFSITGINKVNAVYDASKHQPDGVGFVTDLLDRLEITRIIENYETLDSFDGKPFITVSNHPYGHIDGIMAISIIAAKRRDYKMMANWMLKRIDTMAEHFIGVNPYAKDSKMTGLHSSMGGIKECIHHLNDGHPLGFFPAGGISMPHWTRPPEDREWQPSVLKLIKKAKVPVIPMFISGNNSLFFQFLGLIDWRVRQVRLCHEVYNKRGKTITVSLKQPISVEEQEQYDDIRAYGEFLKRRTISFGE